METVNDFYEKYQLESFYAKQKTYTKNEIIPFKREIQKKLSFGLIPGYRNFDLFYERYRSGVEILKNKGIIREGIRVLDIGSGEAYFKFFFDGMCSEKIEWHGVEVWHERAEFCRHVGYTIQEVTLENGKLPYEDQFFDIVLASHVLEHLPNPEQIIGEMNRVLKPKGCVLIGTPTKPPIIAELDSWYHRLGSRDTGDTQQAFTHQRLEKLILRAMNLDKSAVVDKRGFRLISARKKLPIENWKWYYNFSTFIGKALMFLVPEVNVIVQKPEKG